MISQYWVGSHNLSTEFMDGHGSSQLSALTFPLTGISKNRTIYSLEHRICVWNNTNIFQKAEVQKRTGWNFCLLFQWSFLLQLPNSMSVTPPGLEIVEKTKKIRDPYAGSNLLGDHWIYCDRVFPKCWNRTITQKMFFLAGVKQPCQSVLVAAWNTVIQDRVARGIPMLCPLFAPSTEADILRETATSPGGVLPDCSLWPFKQPEW